MTLMEHKSPRGDVILETPKFSLWRFGHKLQIKMDSLSKDLLKKLECPVCMEYMLSPISMCANGHNICVNCRRVLNICPSCSQPFIKTRNKSLERSAKDVQHPCIYKKFGCKEAIFIDLIPQHQAACPYGPHTCLFAKLAKERCGWEGPLADTERHLTSDHSKHVRKMKGKEVIVCTNYTYCQALLCLGEVFMYFCKVKDGIFYSCVLHVGPKDKASKFSYKITISTTDKKESASMCLVTRSSMEDINEIFRNGSCALFHYNFVTNCTRVFGGLPIEVEIFASK